MTDIYYEPLPFGPLFKGLAADNTAKHYKRMGPSVWLYLYLITSVNVRTGTLVTCFPDIAAEMGLSEATLRSWLGHLRKWHYVKIKNDNRQTILKIVKWKTWSKDFFKASVTSKPKNTSKKKAVFPEFTLKRLLTREEAQKLAESIAGAFKEPQNRNFILGACQSYHPEMLQEAFSKVAAMPSSRIRKSRSALFIYLTKQYAHQTN